MVQRSVGLAREPERHLKRGLGPAKVANDIPAIAVFKFVITDTHNCRGCEAACQGGQLMAAILTAEDVVRCIAVEGAYVDERGGIGIRLQPAAAIVRQYGKQFRQVSRRRRTGRSPKPPRLL